MVYRVYVEKREGFTAEADSLLREIRGTLGIESVTGVRVLNRYDVEKIDEDLFRTACRFVFSEPQMDRCTYELEDGGCRHIFAVSYLPGQFDQRADSAEQCIQIISRGERPLVRTAKVYLLFGDLTEKEEQRIREYVINPVECELTTLEPFETLKMEIVPPSSVPTLDGFNQYGKEELDGFVRKYGLAMDEDDLAFCQSYFRKEGRDPTLTEIRMIDTYWSDHCRHTTFLTTLDHVTFEEPLAQKTYETYLEKRRELGRKKPVNLMDIATAGMRYLKATGKLPKLDESEEINACTVKIKVRVNGEDQDWLLLFKNETHNHPTEIEPFGGAATCIGGAIRDPLSGRSYVYAAMRVTGAADPLKPLSETIPGKLPQRKIVTTAAAGYSSYGNQIGLATGMVDELYHPGYAAKRMEIGAVIAATPAENVVREVPEPGDKVILLGGRTGRDGCGGATGSSKSHTVKSLSSCGAEVQKGNAPEERKLQRLFRNREASRLIRRCNDFGAGGVSVAVGELADGLYIDLNAVPKKYEGLDGTELAISESQERMAVVVRPEHVERFCQIAQSENLEATVIATVTEEKRLKMEWNGRVIVDLSRDFLNSNGAEKHVDALVEKAKPYHVEVPGDVEEAFRACVTDLNVCSKRGLSERFDSTIGAGTVLMPFGGKYQQTPIQAMVHKISLEHGDTDTVSYMAWGYNPYLTQNSPYHGAYYAVIESVSKLIATGASFEDVYLTFQEYFEKPKAEPRRWGKPLAALLGALQAQLDLGIASIGGKDSMSGTFEQIDVPPTLVSFAVTTGKIGEVISPEFKGAGHTVLRLSPAYDGQTKLPLTDSLLKEYGYLTSLIRLGCVISAYTPTYGGEAEALFKMSLGNRVGFALDAHVSWPELFTHSYGGFVVECADGVNPADLPDAPAGVGIQVLGTTRERYEFCVGDRVLSLADLQNLYEGKLEPVYSCNILQDQGKVDLLESSKSVLSKPKVGCAKPRILLPVFPGTNCEYDSVRAMEAAGAQAEVFVIRNLTSSAIAESVDRFAERIKDCQVIFIPGGFSGGDEPDGSGKFITAFFRNARIKEAVERLLNQRDGLMCGICNGFQALIKLGLVPYGKIMDTDEHSPTLTYNTIARHQSRLVRTRVTSHNSPWLAHTEPGQIYTVPISHGEGRFCASPELIRQLAENGQIATQYVDLDGQPTADVSFNPNNSACAIEGLLSPDGRVLGKMGHSERIGSGLYRNVPGQYNMHLFQSAVDYYKL
ncbi:MAG: phosphoribosylformylglycinamidine synthase [Clostridia bacterium]|nr:phosphoribosylformylglycinamidine synthase [Clostridia bacterium]